VFDHEKLDVYQLELEFITWVTDLLVEIKSGPTSATREVRDQLDRASLSALLNTAEGNGKRQAPCGLASSMTHADRRPSALHAWTRWWQSVPALASESVKAN